MSTMPAVDGLQPSPDTEISTTRMPRRKVRGIVVALVLAAVLAISGLATYFVLGPDSGADATFSDTEVLDDEDEVPAVTMGSVGVAAGETYNTPWTIDNLGTGYNNAKSSEAVSFTNDGTLPATLMVSAINLDPDSNAALLEVLEVQVYVNGAAATDWKSMSDFDDSPLVLVADYNVGYEANVSFAARVPASVGNELAGASVQAESVSITAVERQ